MQKDTEATIYGGANYRTEGVDIGTTPDASGLKVGHIATGQEWLKYTLNVAQSGNYDVAFRVSSGNSGGSLHLEDAAGNNLTGSVTFDGTGGWDAFTTVTKQNVALSAGQQTFKVVFESGSMDFNWLSFGASTAWPVSSAGFVKTDATTQGNWKTKYGNDGYNVINDAADYPNYAAVSVAGQSDHTWEASTTEARALQKAAAGSTDRIAATVVYQPKSVHH